MRSARYAGETATDGENLAKLLREAPAGSALAYVCALAYVDAATAPSTCSRAAAPARSRPEPRGDGGFGYDPAFLPDDVADGRTMAELARRGEGRDQPPRPRGQGAAGAAQRRLIAALAATASDSTA